MTKSIEHWRWFIPLNEPGFSREPPLIVVSTAPLRLLVRVNVEYPTFCDCLNSRLVVLLGLIDEPEERKEDEGAHHIRPAGTLDCEVRPGVRAPDACGNWSTRLKP